MPLSVFLRFKWKKIALRVLPTDLAFEDTLRRLLTLALSDGILDGVKTWVDLERLEAAAGGISWTCSIPGLKHDNLYHPRATCRSILKGEACSKEHCTFGHDYLEIRKSVHQQRRQEAARNEIVHLQSLKRDFKAGGGRARGGAQSRGRGA